MSNPLNVRFPKQQQTAVDPEKLFTKLERIGKGSFGEVYKGINNKTQEVSSRNIYSVPSLYCFHIIYVDAGHVR